MKDLIFDFVLTTAGVATHSLDWRKSAGGFIHGYRYTGTCTSLYLMHCIVLPCTTAYDTEFHSMYPYCTFSESASPNLGMEEPWRAVEAS